MPNNFIVFIPIIALLLLLIWAALSIQDINGKMERDRQAQERFISGLNNLGKQLEKRIIPPAPPIDPLKRKGI